MFVGLDSPHEYYSYTYTIVISLTQWDFQDPKMEVLYHIRPYVAGIFTYIGPKHRPYIW